MLGAGAHEHQIGCGSGRKSQESVQVRRQWGPEPGRAIVMERAAITGEALAEFAKDQLKRSGEKEKPEMMLTWSPGLQEHGDRCSGRDFCSRS